MLKDKDTFLVSNNKTKQKQTALNFSFKLLTILKGPSRAALLHNGDLSVEALTAIIPLPSSSYFTLQGKK